MIREVLMPQLAMGMSEGTILEWAIPEGGLVERDAVALSIETEKVATELPSPYKGYLHIVEEVGATVPVEQIIAYIASTEEEYRELVSSGKAASAKAAASAVESVPAGESPPVTTASEAGPKGRIKVSGLARKIARLEGIELAAVTGTGPGGRIVRRDVLQAVEAKSRAHAAAPVAASATVEMTELARIPLTGMRGAIAKSVHQASSLAAQTNSFSEVDVTKLLAMQKTLRDREEELGVRVPLNALIIKALAVSARSVPAINATIDDKGVSIWQNVNVAFAVAMPGVNEHDSGIAMPVVKNAQAKSVLEIAMEMKDLVGRARTGQLTAQDISDHTMLLSSTTGMATNNTWSISAPILKLPAIFAFQPGTPVRKPVVIDDEIVARDMLPCGLTFDHRGTDGAPIGFFVNKLLDLLSNPELMIL